MKVECPYKDWEGEQAFLTLHLKEIHKIDANPEPGSINNPIQLPKTKKADNWIDRMTKSREFWIAVGFFIIGWIMRGSA